MAWTLNSTDLQDVQKEDHTKDAQLFTMPLPASDSTSTIVIDLFGTIRNIMVDGVFAETLANQRTFISTIEGYVDGSQTKVVYHSDKTNTNYNVFVKTFRWWATSGDVNKINYVLELIESS